MFETLPSVPPGMGMFSTVFPQDLSLKEHGLAQAGESALSEGWVP